MIPEHHFGKGRTIYFCWPSCVVPSLLQRAMEASVPSVRLLDLNNFWEKAGKLRKGWCPAQYHCGAYDPSLDGFPVLRSHHHIIYIPASSKPDLRFLQHAMYALWYMSYSKRFSKATRATLLRGSGYMHFLREAFFDEVRDQFYPSLGDSRSQDIPSCNRMTRQWVSSILFSWAQVTYHSCNIAPPKPPWSPKKANGEPQTVSVILGEYPIFSAHLHYEQERRLGRLVSVT